MNLKWYPEREVEDIKGWWWIESDTGAWDGPKKDWSSHLRCIEKYVTQHHVVVQAGGNLGMYPRLLAKHFNLVFTFEPDPLNFSCLQKNLAETYNVTSYLGAVGAEKGTCLVQRRDMGNVGMHQVTTEKPGDTPMYALDEFNFSHVGLLMLDIEGYEYKALQGAQNLIERNKPIIFLERPGDDSTDFLVRMGYEQAETSEMDVVFRPRA